MDTYDQRDAIAEQRFQEPQQGTDKSYRMMESAIRRAAHGIHVLVVVGNRATVSRLSCFIPLDLSRFITVRCMDSHQDINWVKWLAPGWEDHQLYVDHLVLEQRFPHLIEMLKY